MQWKCWCSDPNTPLDCPGLDLNKYCRGGLLRRAREREMTEQRVGGRERGRP